MMKIFGLKYLNISIHKSIIMYLHWEFNWAYQKSQHTYKELIFFNKIWATEKSFLEVSITFNLLMIKCNLGDYYYFMTTENNENIFIIKVTEGKGRDNVTEKYLKK